MRPDASIRAEAIVLAAGASTRFEGAKLVAPYQDEPLILASVRKALACQVRSVTVVLGAYADELERALRLCHDDRLEVVRNVAWQTGMASSIRCGLDSVATDTEAVLIFLADMPNVSVDLANRTLAAVSNGASASHPIVAGVPGHPVAISRSKFSALYDLSGDQGARGLLAGRSDVVSIETTDVGAIQDVDTRSDLRELA